MLRLTLKRCLRKHKLNEAMLADAIAELNIGLEHPVSERYLRYLTQNASLLIPTNSKRKPSLIMLGIIISGLQYLTEESIDIGDVLEVSN